MVVFQRIVWGCVSTEGGGFYSSLRLKAGEEGAMESGGEELWGGGRREGVRVGRKEGWFYSQRGVSPTPSLAWQFLTPSLLLLPLPHSLR